MTTRFWLTRNLICLMLTLGSAIAQNNIQQNDEQAVKAFPTAGGFGAGSRGGRGGRVIEVTNLNDSGEGSLRSAMETSGPRICVFRVSGTITLNNAIRVSSPYLTVAGQTSPGGVQIKGNQKPEGDWGVWFVNGAHDIIVRHLRVRMGGNMQHDAGNNLLFYGTDEPGVHDVIVDHCSVCWGSDTQLDWYGSYLDRATFQWNIIAEADMGSHIGGNLAPKNITLHHNLYANLGSRTPLMQHADVFDFRNNVIYNWNGNNSAVFGQFALNSSAFGNVVDNLWLAGPESGYPYLNVGNGGPVRIDGSAAEEGGTKLYISGNWGPRCPNGGTNDWTGHGVNTWDYYELKGDGSTHLVDQAQYDAGKPFPAPPIVLDPVSELLDRVLPAAGAYKPSRDAIDQRIVKSVRDKTGTYRVNTGGPWPDLAAGAPVPPPDADHDGMPDAWEKAHGFDPNNSDDGAALAANGYTNVENYLNELAGDTIPGFSEAVDPDVPSSEAVFYVSPRGNDTWSGRIAAPDETDGPFATIGRAQQAVRKNRKTHPQSAVRVMLCGGTYYLESPLEFGPEDSGTEDAPVVYAAAAGEKVIISGGRRLEGGKWGEVNGQKAWVLDIPEVKEGRWNFRQLFVNGQRRPRPRLPREGEYQIEALPDVAISNETWTEPVRRFVYAGTDIQQWHNLTDVEVVAPCRWVDNRLPIQQIDPDKRIVTFDRSSRFNLVELYHTKPSTYWVENIIEALDTPGQWYLDRPLGRLYYLPVRSQDMATAELVAPRLAQLMKLIGLQDAPVGFLRFEGITFAHTQWPPPPDWAISSQAAVDVPGALSFTHANRCTVSKCRVEHVGTYAVEIGAGCRDIEISHNRLADLGGGGVKVGHDSRSTTVADNEIVHAGRIFMSAVGIWIGHSAGNNIVHNHIQDLNYSGISVGWQWDFKPSKAVNNIVEHNHIHDIGHGLLSDMGGIYTLGVSPGTRLRYNVIHDVKARAYGGWGIYPDEGSSEILIEKNLVYRCSSSPFFAHINRNITVQNNIFALGEQCQVERAGATSGPEQEYAFMRNLVYYRQGQLVGYWDTRNRNFSYKSNLYWNASGSPVTFSGKSWDEWQAAGQDKDSVIADPLFVDPEHSDFRLQTDSPAAQIGFEPWDLSDVGPRHISTAEKMLGPLRVHPDNPRYFTDGSGRAIYLTGSHTWYNLQDSGTIGESLTGFDYDAYLDLLQSSGHNFMRMWAWEGGVNEKYCEPLAYSRTGPGTALDGKPKFDLERFDREYFGRLRSRVAAAEQRGIFVSIMLFQGWSIYSHGYGNPWPLHPFNKANNINGTDGDANGDGEGKEVHALQLPAITSLQEAYIRKVIDTVNDLDNVLYEITNETAIFSRDWQYHMVRYIKEYEAAKPKQHPVGMSAFDSGREGSMAALYGSPADWIAPQNDGDAGDFMNDPPAADGRKIMISDTDHLWGVGGDRVWVWKSFTRGFHIIYMDPVTKPDGAVEPLWIESRKAMGLTLSLAGRMNMAKMVPCNELASTRYCLASPAAEYLVYLPKGGEVTVDLTANTGPFEVEWIHPVDGTVTKGKTALGGGKRAFKAPLSGDIVLYIRSRQQ